MLQKMLAVAGIIVILAALGAFAYTSTAKSSADKIKCPINGQIIDEKDCPVKKPQACSDCPPCPLCP